MIRGGLLALILAAHVATAQDTSFSRLNIGASLLRAPVVGHMGDDWRPGTGLQVHVGSNVGHGDLTLSVGHLKFEPLTGKPKFTETQVSLGWTASLIAANRIGVQAGARLTDVRMDFNDPTTVVGLRTEEEVMLSAVGRGRILLGRGFSGVGEVTAGYLMLSTHSPRVQISAGLERGFAMPGWIRAVLR